MSTFEIKDEDGFAEVYEQTHQQSMSRDPEQAFYGKIMKDMLPILERYAETESAAEKTVAILATGKAFAIMIANLAACPPVGSGVMLFIFIAENLRTIIKMHPSLQKDQDLIYKVMAMALAGEGDAARDLVMAEAKK